MRSLIVSLIALFGLSIAPVAYCASCTAVTGDRIFAGDIAPQVPAFARLDPKIVVGLSPFPGTRRIVTAHELDAIARRNGAQSEGPPADVCFERALTPLTAEQIRAAIMSSMSNIGIEDATIEVIDFPRQAIPSGQLEFPRSGLTPLPASRPDGPAFWRGAIRYSPQHTLAIWASVRLSIRQRVITAARGIPSGAVVSVDDLAEVERDIFPFTPRLEAKGDALGRVARKTIPAGALISPALLEVPPDIARGETVHVVATNGAARISFDAVAQSSGRKGDRIVLLNPQSHKSFRAVVDGPSRAQIGTGT
jgi:flagella basal body P-ring formation protein FlgA